METGIEERIPIEEAKYTLWWEDEERRPQAYCCYMITSIQISCIPISIPTPFFLKKKHNLEIPTIVTIMITIIIIGLVAPTEFESLLSNTI